MFGGLVAAKSRRVRKVRQHRLQRAALMMRLAEIAQANMRLVLDLIFQRRRQARFTDARLAGEQDHAAFVVFEPLPAPQQQLHFLVAADQRCAAFRAQGFEAAGDAALAQHAPRRNEPGKALQLGRRNRFVFEDVAGEPPRRRIDDQGVRRGERLQTGGEIGRLADYIALLRLAGADQFAHHDQPGGKPDAHLMTAVGGEKLRDRIDQRECAAYGIFSVVFVRLRIAEINKNTVAHIFGHVAAETGDDLGGASVIGGDDFAQILRIEAGGERGRADEVAEHHGDLPPLGRVGAPCKRRRLRGAGGGWGGGRRGRSFPKLGAALCAKARAGRIGVATPVAGQRLRCSALRAETGIARNVAAAARAGFGFGHANNPPCAIFRGE